MTGKLNKGFTLIELLVVIDEGHGDGDRNDGRKDDRR
jgi:hypothetical protein